MLSLPSLNMFYIFVSINQSLKAHTNVPQVTFPDFSVQEGKMGPNRIVSKFYSEHRQ